MRSRAPTIEQCRTSDGGGGGDAVRVLAACAQVDVEYAGTRALHEAQRTAHHPHARHRISAQLLSGAVRPSSDQFKGHVIVGARRVEQRLRSRSSGRPDRAARCATIRDGNRDAASSATRARPASGRRAPPHAMPAASSTRGESSRAIASTRSSGAPDDRPWPGRSTAMTLLTVMREVARLQRADAVVVRRAVHEHDRRTTTGRSAACPCSSRRRRRRPWTRITPCPRRGALGTDLRAGRPHLRGLSTGGWCRGGCRRATRDAASDMRKCVVDAGWITSDLASPTLARCENNAQRLDELATGRPCVACAAFQR